MSIDDAGLLHIRSDLQFEVDGVRATLLSDGQDLTLVTDDPGPLLVQARSAAAQAATGGSLRSLSARLARVVDRSGLSARVVGRRGVLLEVGRGCDSRVGRMLTGCDNVCLGRPRAVLPALGAYLGATLRESPRGREVLGGLALAIVLTGVGQRARTSRGSIAP